MKRVAAIRNRYNRSVFQSAFLGICLSLALLTSCSGPQQNKQAVERGVRQYLASRAGLDLNSMNVTVTSVSFRDKEAEASVTFQAKGSSDPANAMQMRYVLEQKGNEWVVKGRSGGSDHGMSPPAPTGLPPGHPQVSTPQSGQKP